MVELRRIREQGDWQRHIGSIVHAINRDPALALAAACNPFLALAELGYELDPAVIADLEERARFSKRQIAERRKLRADLAKALARPIESLTRDSLVDMLDANGRPAQTKKAYAKDEGRTAVMTHEVRELAVQLLAIEEGTRRFADAQTYAAIRSGKRKFRLIKLKARLAADRREPAKARPKTQSNVRQGKPDNKGKGRA